MKTTTTPVIRSLDDLCTALTARGFTIEHVGHDPGMHVALLYDDQLVIHVDVDVTPRGLFYGVPTSPEFLRRLPLPPRYGEVSYFDDFSDLAAFLATITQFHRHGELVRTPRQRVCA